MVTLVCAASNTEFIFLQVLNEANFTNAVLVRSVLTRSDLGGALIEGADFSDAVIDLPQKQVFISLFFFFSFFELQLLVLFPCVLYRFHA